MPMNVYNESMKNKKEKMTVPNFNPEILSNKATHISPKYGPIKVFTLKVKGTDRNGRLLCTAEILTGDAAGKWGSFYVDEIKKISN